MMLALAIMFLRLEIFGHYLELGRTAEPEEVGDPVPDNVPQPMQVYVEPPLGFRIIGDDGEIATDV